MSGDVQIDLETAQIMASNLADLVGHPLIAILETPDGYQVLQHTRDSVLPVTTYRSKREAASRVLQLLNIGPVGPQTWPETACIGKVNGDVG